MTANLTAAAQSKITEPGHLSYDQVPYPSYSYAESHPDRLAALASLFGMAPAPVANCRVLELGCAGGGNLIPMAYGLPDSEFVGLDLSGRQIAAGQAMVETLGLKNISLKAMDILDVGAEFGQFDYIITHGIYSWVPPQVRDKILAICQQHLAPQGVCYISYNTYPGWHMIGMIREMMLYHTRNLTDPAEQANEARHFLEFLAEVVPEAKPSYRAYLQMYSGFLQGEIEDTPAKSDALLLHDELSAINQPFYFHQFMTQAETYGLQYLSEAEFRALPPGEKAAQISRAVGQMATNLIEAEQYLDFIQQRTFRQTLLVHQGVALNRTLSPERLEQFQLLSRAKPVSETPDIHSVQTEQFQSPPNRAEDGVMFSTNHPLVKAALVHLDQIWPAAISFQALLQAARKRLDLAPPAAEGQPLDEEGRLLGINLLACFSRGLLTLHTHVPQFTTQVSQHPLASPIARLLSATRRSHITNLWHQRIEVDRFDQFLLRHLDGKHDYQALLQACLAGPVAEGVLEIRQDEVDQTEADLETVLTQELNRHLQWLARAGVLIG